MKKPNVKENPVTPATSLGLSIGIALIALTRIGEKVDQKLGTTYWVVVGLITGICYSAYQIWLIVRQENNNKRD